MVFKPNQLHIWGVAVQPPDWSDDSPEDGSGLHTAVPLLINHIFVQVTISTLDLGCLAKSLDMILIAMGTDSKLQMCSVEVL